MAPKGPHKLTPTDFARALDALRRGADITIAARAAGMSRSGFYEALSKNPAWKEQVDEARAIADDDVQAALYRMAVVEQNPTAAIFWLKNRRPVEWRDRKEIAATLSLSELIAQSLEEPGPDVG